MQRAGRDSTAPARRRAKALALLAALALLLHAGLLEGVRWTWPARVATPIPAMAIHIRTVPGEPPALPVAAAAPLAAPAPERAALPPKRRVAADAPAANKRASQPESAPASVSAASAPEEPASAEVAAAPPAPDVRASLARPEAPSDNEIPVYRTRIPPAVTLHYELRRGALQGSGELQWRPQGERYDARLEGRLAGMSIFTQTSQGGFDAAGLAPERFTDQRARRDVRAANFQREAGKITFSGPSTEFPLMVGAQDRLSWMIQLASVLAAEPHRLVDGGKVAMVVVGARGDLGIWVFRYVDQEWVSTGDALVRAAKFMREPHHAYDTGVEVWLDTERHYLPVRAVLRAGPEGEALELLLQHMNAAQ